MFKGMRGGYNLIRGRPMFAQFAITHLCNSKCPSCWYWINGSDNDVSLQEAARIANQLWDYGVRIVTITGGEPFVREDAVEIIRLFHERGFRVAINTNGTLLTKELIARLSDIGKLHIMISLDSLEEDGYEKIRGVRALGHVKKTLAYLHRETPHEVRTFTTVSSLNFHEVPAILDYCKEHGYKSSLYPVMAAERGNWFTSHHLLQEEDRESIARLFESLSEQAKSDPTLFGFSTTYQGSADYLRGEHTGDCGAGKVMLQINPDGTVSACPESPPFCDLRTQNLEEAYAVRGWEQWVRTCYIETPCYIGCTRTIQSVRKAPVKTVIETARKVF